MQDGLTDTYTTYACGFKPSTIAPVGEAYRILKNEYPDEFGLLYKPDGSHPSSDLGRYLGACVHYSTLFGKPCLGNSYLIGFSNKNATNIKVVANLSSALLQMQPFLKQIGTTMKIPIVNCHFGVKIYC